MRFLYVDYFPLVLHIIRLLFFKFMNGDRPLLRFLKASLGVSRCERPLLRLSLPGIGAAALRCSSARMACGVVGGPFFSGGALCGRRSPGVRDWQICDLLVSLDIEGELLTEVCRIGVVGFCVFLGTWRSYG